MSTSRAVVPTRSPAAAGDNDDDARKLPNTCTWVAWDGIMQEWDTMGIAMYALVRNNTPLTRTR